MCRAETQQRKHDPSFSPRLPSLGIQPLPLRLVLHLPIVLVPIFLFFFFCFQKDSEHPYSRKKTTLTPQHCTPVHPNLTRTVSQPNLVPACPQHRALFSLILFCSSGRLSECLVSTSQPFTLCSLASTPSYPSIKSKKYGSSQWTRLLIVGFWHLLWPGLSLP